MVGSSPEPMVRLRDGVVTSRPIAGSRPRGRSAHEDELAAGQLIEDPKELAEHVMLVDLARNDVGRVVRFGTEKVDEFMTVERYSHIMHLTSQVTGTLRDDRGPIDVLRATLPAGTLSGAPKVRAMEIIDELEPTKRGPYGGVVGYLDFSGNLDTAIAIRTMVVAPDGRASVQAGAGIVADSDPETEDAECAHKAAALLAAVAAARRLAVAREARACDVTREAVEAGLPPAARATSARSHCRRDVVRVAGPDAALLPPGPVQPGPGPSLSRGQAADTLLLAPDGKLEALARVVRLERRGLPPRRRRRATARRLVGALGPLQAPLEARDRSSSTGTCVALRGPATPGPDAASSRRWSRRSSGTAGRGSTSSDRAGSVEVPESVPWCAAPACEAARIESGVPVMGRELTGGEIPAETGTVSSAR